jgi:tRNA-Thr(GGU) m(6)t(6)A37 methyltransferase TsaA
MTTDIVLTPIGFVRSPVAVPLHDVWGRLKSTIELDRSRFTQAALTGLNEYSHVEIIFVLDRIPDADIEYGASRPRGKAGWPEVGIFAKRSRNRPNRIAVTVCRLVSVDDLSIQVENLDAIDGTPVVDIKPYIREFGPKGDVRQPAWATELMSTYWNELKR